MMVEWLGLIGGLALLIVLTMRGFDLLLAAPVCALLVASSFALPLFPQTAGGGGASFSAAYMAGFTGFLASWFLVFLLGAVFGKLMEDSGAADSVAHWVVGRFGAKHALFAIVAACALLTYGGVSLFVVAFSVFPLGLALFREAGFPRRFLPATIAFGSVTFTMTSAGSPEIQNWIPVEFLGTTPYAAWQVSLVVACFMAVSGFVWLQWMVRRAVAGGEDFERRDDDPAPKSGGLPHPATGLVPLATVLGVAYWLHDSLKQSALLVALLAGVLVVLVVNRRYFVNLRQAATDGTMGALIAIANTSAVVGFGAIAKLSPAFAAGGRRTYLAAGRPAGRRRGRRDPDRRLDRIGVRRAGDRAADPCAALHGARRGRAGPAPGGRDRIGRARLAAAQRLRGHHHTRRLPRDPPLGLLAGVLPDRSGPARGARPRRAVVRTDSLGAVRAGLRCCTATAWLLNRYRREYERQLAAPCRCENIAGNSDGRMTEFRRGQQGAHPMPGRARG